MFAHGSPGPLVLGIDPGLTRCGYALVRDAGSGHGAAVSLGVLTTPSAHPLDRRLGQLLDDVEALIADFAPEAVAIERVFFQSNTRTAMTVAQASGVVMAAASRRGLGVVEYTPSQVKDAVAGWGGANKQQMQEMVRARLGLERIPTPADAADAAAVALCHLAASPLARRIAAAARAGDGE